MSEDSVKVERKSNPSSHRAPALVPTSDAAAGERDMYDELEDFLND